MTYDDLVIPTAKKGERLLDFGSGTGESVRKARNAGIAAYDIEFFRRIGQSINTRAVHRMCDLLFSTLRKHGLFDIVVCDFVLNSVDSVTAEEDVLHCINAFCKPGGKLFFSGRSREGVESRAAATLTSQAQMRHVEFCDADGFTADFIRGEWFFQKYHYRDRVLELVRQYATTGEAMLRENESQWRVGCTKDVQLDHDRVLQAIHREFSLPWPDGNSVGRGDEAVAAYLAALELEKAKA